MSDGFELLEQAPLVLGRPLALLNGQAYAAAWPFVRQATAPVAPARQTLWVVRDDGQAFGEGAGQPLAALGLTVRLGGRPPNDRLWSTAGLQAFRQGARPDPAEVFERMRAVVDRFIDFDHSLAAQRTMTEFVAAYALSTWLLEAFGVVGFLWPSGDRGSGKTNLLHVVTQLSYLGTVLTAGGSFASLRDLADYGATLAFDDAEQLAEGGKGDPDMRALLLAGNRRGAVVTLKEAAPGGKGWQTRYVNAFCPRLFSAIRLPDPVLASRAVVVPLVRTADRERANADPLDFAAWPTDRQTLVDDLWALALAPTGLPALPAFDAQAAARARLSGRPLQPWRGVLGVALWLEAYGLAGLHGRLEQLALAYQAERPELEADDLTSVVVKVLMYLYQQAARRNLGPEPLEACHVHMSEILPGVEALYNQPGRPNRGLAVQRVGFVLGKLRVSRSRVNGKEARQWVVTREDVKRWARSYGALMPAREGDEGEGDRGRGE